MELKENRSELLEALMEKVESYGKTNLELIAFKSVDKSANILSSMISNAIVMILIFLFVTLLSIAASLWLGDFFEKRYYGFLCVAAFYALTGSVLYFFKENLIKKAVQNSIIAKLLN